MRKLKKFLKMGALNDLYLDALTALKLCYQNDFKKHFNFF